MRTADVMKIPCMPARARHRRKPPAPPPPDCKSWSASRFVAGDLSQVLDSLTDPELIGVWSPIDFEVDGLRGRRLRSGSHAWVHGSLGGVSADFEVDVARADDRGLQLTARGPLTLDVDYRIQALDVGALIHATVGIQRERGLNGRVLRAATSALLNSGALERALRRLAGELDYEAGALAA